jgi:hypothetical protein
MFAQSYPICRRNKCSPFEFDECRQLLGTTLGQIILRYGIYACPIHPFWFWMQLGARMLC